MFQLKNILAVSCVITDVIIYYIKRVSPSVSLYVCNIAYSSKTKHRINVIITHMAPVSVQKMKMGGGMVAILPYMGWWSDCSNYKFFFLFSCKVVTSYSLWKDISEIHLIKLTHLRTLVVQMVCKLNFVNLWY